MNVLIVIVNYRTSGLTVDCLRSLEAEVAAVPGSRVVVVENASGDDSAAVLSAAIAANGWGSWAELVESPSNGGFAAGNNVALAPAFSSASPPDYAWLLNPDTVVRPGALSELVGFLERRPDVGLAGSRLEHPDGRAQRSSFRFPTILGELEGGLRLGLATRLLERHVVSPPVPEGECRVDWVAGASLLVRRAVFEAVGLLDDGYFMYYEEVDFCLKANRAGWPCWYVPSSRVVHLVGQSSGVTAKGRERRRLPRYWFEARRRFFVANHGRAKALAANLAYLFANASCRLRWLIQGRPNTDPERMLLDFVRYNFLAGKR
jgi:N-acetylglucosaminyl-diphospho-decaprenol L-rhamnosyltransferase